MHAEMVRRGELGSHPVLLSSPEVPTNRTGQGGGADGTGGGSDGSGGEGGGAHSGHPLHFTAQLHCHREQRARGL